MRIHVHLGVHKTATTFIQAVLEMNRPALNAAGIGYMPLEPFRERVANRIEGLPPSARIDDFIDGFFEGPPPAEIKGLLISEENLIGNNAVTVQTGFMYPRADIRLNLVRNLLRGHDVTAFLCVRAYDEYITSQYCEALRWGDFVRFGDFRKRMKFETFRWPFLYTRINNSLKPDDMRMWRYEDFRKNAETILRAMAFGYDGPLNLTHEDVKPSMSHAAVERLHDIERTLGAAAAKSQVRQVESELPKAPGRPAYDPWTGQEHLRLRQIYDADCAGAPDKWLVRPPQPAEARPAPAVAN